MIARLLISSSLDERIGEIEKMLSDNGIRGNHPDLLYFPANSKLGIESAKMIKTHFSKKPYSAKGRAVALEDAAGLTTEAQNALLKTLEEPPPEALLILGAGSEAKLLPTILSRCQIIRIKLPFGGPELRVKNEKQQKEIDELIKASIQERFEYIEKLKDKEEFLKFMTSHLHQKLALHPKGANVSFLKELLQAEGWAQQNVNIRAILEYLMLVMPKVL